MTEIELPVFGEYTLNVPAWFAVKTNYYGNPSRKVWWKLANPMSNARNLASRKKDLSVNVERSGVINPEVNQEYPNMEDIEVEKFSSEDQNRIRKWARASKDDIFSNHPALPRGRPEIMKKNEEINRNFRGYDDDFLNMVRKTRDGKIIKKTGFTGFKPEKGSTYFKEKAPSVSDLGDALHNLFGEVEEVQSENKPASENDWMDTFIELIDEFGDDIEFRNDLYDEIRSVIEVQSESSEKLSKKSEKIIKQGTPKQVINEVEALLFADDTPSVSSKKSGYSTPSYIPTPSVSSKTSTPKKKYSPRTPTEPPPKSSYGPKTPSLSGLSRSNYRDISETSRYGFDELPGETFPPMPKKKTR